MYYHPRHLAACWAFLGGLLQGARASSWAIYSDADCQTSVNTIPGENGYPDGVCTDVAESAARYGSYKGFAFITMDTDCNPTIYQADTTADSCSGYAIIAEIGVCYNTSWHYYSIDMCTTATASSSLAAAAAATATSTSASSSASSSSSSSSSSSAEATTAIAGAVVGCVVGLGAIAALCLYFFWFRPRQRRAARQREIEEHSDSAGLFSKAHMAVQVGDMQEKGDDFFQRGGPAPAVEMHQLPPELLTPLDRPELASGAAAVPEAPGSAAGGGHELGATTRSEQAAPVELPGDHEYQSSGSGSPGPTSSERRGGRG